jgi:tetrahydromethanopterin S-methyltransferase subunit G
MAQNGRTGVAASMSEQQIQVLDLVREQFSGVHSKLDRIADDVTNLKVRMSGIEAEVGYVRVALAELNSRMDRADRRLDRIESRLDLAEAESSLRVGLRVTGCTTPAAPRTTDSADRTPASRPA